MITIWVFQWGGIISRNKFLFIIIEKSKLFRNKILSKINITFIIIKYLRILSHWFLKWVFIIRVHKVIILVENLIAGISLVKVIILDLILLVALADVLLIKHKALWLLLLLLVLLLLLLLLLIFKFFVMCLREVNQTNWFILSFSIVRIAENWLCLLLTNYLIIKKTLWAIILGCALVDNIVKKAFWLYGRLSCLICLLLNKESL